MGRPCWVCGAPDSTKEHVWPEWLQKVISTALLDYRVGVSHDPTSWRQWTGAAFQHTSRVLCDVCNGTLGELEGKVAQLIPQMVNGESVRLGSVEQTLLAQWFYKTGLMVATTARHNASDLPKTHYERFSQTLDLPPTSEAWIAQIDRPRYSAALWLQRFDWQDQLVNDAPEAQGYIFALSVATVAGVVAVLDSSQSPQSAQMPAFELLGRAPGRLLRIWPSSSHYGVPWPPSMKLTASEFQQLADSFPEMGKRVGATGAPRSGPATRRDTTE